MPETETRGPDHSLYPKVVVPSNMTWVPVFNLVMSSVVPDGTAMLLSTIVEHDVLLLEAEAASVNVQEVARSTNLAAGVGAGAGAADTRAMLALSSTLRRLAG